MATHVITGARFTCTCYEISDLAFLRVLIFVRFSLLWGYQGYLEATFADEQMIGFHCYGATLGLPLGLPVPTSTSLDFIAMGLVGLPWGSLRQRPNDWISLLWGYWGYLGATGANEQIIGFL